MCLKAGTCMSILQSFHSCPSAVGYHFPLGVRIFHSRYQKTIRKGTAQLLEGSLSDAHSSDLVSFFCPVSSSTISHQMHLLHIFLSLERCCCVKEHPLVLGLLRAGCDKPIPHSPSLVTQSVLLLCSSLSPRGWMSLAHFWPQLGPSRLGLPQGLNFWCSHRENQ